MTVTYDFAHRQVQAPHGACLEDRFEIIKEIGDGSFGSVDLARVRTAGANVARRGTLVAIKTMKKTFDSFAACLDLREVIFLRTLPSHIHLVPALDIFLDPLSKKLHICMEYMDGNLYQLMKSRDHKCFDGASVKSILFQILGGLEHIHAHHFFHRDIKPENILVSTSSPQDLSSTFRRYSSLVTPPSTPPTYSVKIADFGLARETHLKLPYTTYVSTRWYRAPEVLLRAGEYSAPVDMWAIGAMAVEIATLKPLFPGGNEVDQVWRVCEIMGSPGNWHNKHGKKVGGGEWREGVRLAGKLGFSFPKMSPHSIDTILRPTHWPAELCEFVTWCLMWDPRSRPTSTQSLQHSYFADATDPLRPKTSSSRHITKKPVDLPKSQRDSGEIPQLTSKASWFRKSLIGRESPAPQQPRPMPEHTISASAISTKPKPQADKRATWAVGAAPPMPILPTIRPISPLSNTVTAQAHAKVASPKAEDSQRSMIDGKAAKKIGRQLSVASNGNHYADLHRQEAERALNGSGVTSPISEHKGGFFSHLRKRARRLSGRHQLPISPPDDIEANAGCGPWSSNRSSMVVDPSVDVTTQDEFKELDRALQNVRYSVETTKPLNLTNRPSVKRHSLPQGGQTRSVGDLSAATPIATRTRRALQLSTNPVHRYDVPDEEDELLDEALLDTNRLSTRLDQDKYYGNRTPLRQSASNIGLSNPYPTPSPSAKRNSVLFGQPDQITTVTPSKGGGEMKWPTPPNSENEWAAAASASIAAAAAAYR
ncbi:MAG: hypothetical protein M1814_006556 [Vezdaea aestivalis]|nr:MAG: hypothetical protein M1814_006556 [Vezdaea aestivalis]